MGDKTNESSGLSRSVIFGFILSLGLIAVPFMMWMTTSFMPQLMLGMFIGATVRFGTDMSLLAIADGDAEDFSSFAKKHIPIVVGIMLVQFGTLIGGAVFWLTGGSLIGAGIVAAMLVAYAYSGLTRMLRVSDDTSEASTDDRESEWDFDVDDVE